MDHAHASQDNDGNRRCYLKVGTSLSVHINLSDDWDNDDVSVVVKHPLHVDYSWS